MVSSESKFKSIKLNNDLYIPSIGFGCYKLVDSKKCVATAIKEGYRLFDTAKLYENEEALGHVFKEAFEQKTVKREDLFIVTKLWCDDHEDPVSALKTSLSKLQIQYVDSYLVHWPIGKIVKGEKPSKVPTHILWANMEKCVELGLCKSIGVSNFNVQLLYDLLSYCKIKPVINQVELHPYFNQEDLVSFCEMFGIKMMAFMPVAKGSSAQRYPHILKNYDLFTNEHIVNLSKKYHKSPNQIVLNWHLNRGIIPLPRSNADDHIIENFHSLDFTMDKADYDVINSLNQNLRICITKDKAFSLGVEIFA